MKIFGGNKKKQDKEAKRDDNNLNVTIEPSKIPKAILETIAEEILEDPNPKPEGETLIPWVDKIRGNRVSSNVIEIEYVSPNIDNGETEMIIE